jgi:hypothetical protein
MASNNATRKSMNGLSNTSTDSANININEILDMNSFKIINLGNGTNSTDAVNLSQISGIATNAADIATNVTAIALNTAKTGITTEQANAIIANTAKIGITTEQANAITANTAAITANDTDIANNLAKINANIGDIALLQVDVANNTTAITANDLDIAANSTAISANSATLVTQAGLISANTTAITANDVDIAANSTAISTQSGLITSNTSAITAIQGDYFKKTGTVPATGIFDMATFKIEDLGEPTSAQDAATKNYVDTNSSQWVTSGSDIKYETGNVFIGDTTGYYSKLVVRDDVTGGYHTDAGTAQISIRGETDATKVLALAFDTTNDHGVIQAGQTGGNTAQRLILQKNGGGVTIGDIGSEPSDLEVKNIYNNSAGSVTTVLMGSDQSPNNVGTGLMTTLQQDADARLIFKNGGDTVTANALGYQTAYFYGGTKMGGQILNNTATTWNSSLGQNIRQYGGQFSITGNHFQATSNTGASGYNSQIFGGSLVLRPGMGMIGGTGTTPKQYAGNILFERYGNYTTTTGINALPTSTTAMAMIDGLTGNFQSKFIRGLEGSALVFCRGDKPTTGSAGTLNLGNAGHHIDCYRGSDGVGRSLYLNYYSTQKILFPAYDIASASDRRIKENFQEIKDDEALQKLRLLNPLTYTYKSTPDHERVYGFIAQEVKEVLPNAVSIEQLCIPNIVARSKVEISEGGGVITILDKTENTDTLVEGRKAQIRYLCCGNKADVIVKKIINSKSFEFEYGEELASLNVELLSGTDTDGNPYTNELILLGTEVDDFHILSKTAIWTVATAALQEVDRQLQAEKVKRKEDNKKFIDLNKRLLVLEDKLLNIESNTEKTYIL